MEAIFLLGHLMEKLREACKDLHMVFIDLGKVYDKVPREAMCWVLEKKGVPLNYFKLIKDMFDRAL